jgi:hypothetical protein
MPLITPLLEGAEQRGAAEAEAGMEGVESAYGLLFFGNSVSTMTLFFATPLLVDSSSGRSSPMQFVAQIIFVACWELAAVASYLLAPSSPTS